MNQPGTITRIIRDLEGAERLRRDEAVRGLWERFFAELTTYARRRLRALNAPTGPADDEDAASRAFTKVCRGIECGQLKLASRVDLTKVLKSATTREVFNLLNRSRCVAGLPEDRLGGIADRSPSPELLLLALDACQRLLDLLDAEEHRQVAVWKLAGHTNDAIAAKLDCSAATVERTLARIRETWRRKWGDAVPRGPARSGPRRGTSEPGGASADLGRDLDDMDRVDEARLLRELSGLR